MKKLTFRVLTLCKILNYLFHSFSKIYYHNIIQQGLCLLYGFLANLPTTVGIECYACADYPNSPTPCGDNTTVLTCPSYYDSCATMVMGFDYSGFNFTTIARNCSMVDYGACNESYICSLVNSSVAPDGILTECSVSCCQDDLCNGPGIYSGGWGRVEGV